MLDPDVQEIRDPFTGGVLAPHIERMRLCVNGLVRFAQLDPNNFGVFTVIVSDNGYARYAQAPLNLGEFL